MLLQLRRPPELQQEFDQYLESLTQGSSPNFHKWLTPTQVGENYGLSDSDLREIERWLRHHGFRVNYVYPNRVVMDISARADELREAFHTDVHFLEVHGEKHFANMNDPEIPEALAPAVVGIVSIHDFRPHPMVRLVPQFNCCGSPTQEVVTPPDLAEIYNFNPLFSQGITGAGQEIAVVEDSDPYTPPSMTNLADYNSFVGASGFNLARYGGSAMVTHPGNCSPPSPPSNGDDGEVELDMQYAQAAAPGAAINVATCANTATSGVFMAIQNLVNATPYPYIISVSYGNCETALGSGGNSAFTSVYSQAAMEGISVYVAAGDYGPALCDFGTPADAVSGITVSGWASTPYNVAVGGTDFGDTAHNENATYWNSTNSPAFQSAKSYVREIPWNTSCASFLIATFVGPTPPYGASGFCGSANGAPYVNNGIIGGSGGPSGCATGAPSSGLSVSGSCAGYAKPPWQMGLFGNPNDGVRDLPDVSIFASNAASSTVWLHFYVYCFSDPSNGGSPCTGPPAVSLGAGGTSFGAPIFAGIQALVNQRTAALTIGPPAGQGNPNPVYYAIAMLEYGASGNSNCDSSSQKPSPRGVATACAFYDVTDGDNNVICTPGTPNCYAPSGSQGVLSTGAITGLTFTGGAGYTSVPKCTISAPHNSTTSYNGSVPATLATCTATINSMTQVVNGVTLMNAGAGYAPIPLCTLTSDTGSGATCAVTGVTVNSVTGYQPAFPTTVGWDFATGIGTPNVYNLVFDPHWKEGP
jgi:subtilase family serine protease